MMKSTQLINAWNKIRVYTAFSGLILMIFLMLTSFSHPFDFDTKAGEGQVMDSHIRDEQNKEAYDRVMEGSKDERDVHKAVDWLNDHIAFKDMCIEVEETEFRITIIGKKTFSMCRD